MAHIILVVLTIITVLAFGSCYKNYSGYQVFRFYPKNHAELTVLNKLHDELQVYIWTSGPIGHAADIMVSPSRIREVKKRLKLAGIHISVMIDDVQRKIELQKPHPEPKAFDLNQYNRYQDIQIWLYQKSQECGERCSFQTIGRSSEERDLWLVKLTDGSGANKPALAYECGIHANEWIGPAVCLNLINKFITDFNNTTAVRNALEWFDWYILPLANPDGYEYSHIEDRMWRKTRSQNSNPATNCQGADPNRNFDFQWAGAGTSGLECSNEYHGASPFSEPETAAIRDIINPIRNKLRAYTAVHSYGQYFLCPWGYVDPAVYPPDYSNITRVAHIGAQAIMIESGLEYIVGNSASLFGATAGSSDDWAKGVNGVNFTYTLELRDTGNNGMLLPPEEIAPTFREIWAAVIAMAQEWHTNFPLPV